MASILVWTDQEGHFDYSAVHCLYCPGLVWGTSLWALHCLSWVFPSWLRLCRARGRAGRSSAGEGRPTPCGIVAHARCLRGPLLRSFRSPGHLFPPPPPSPAHSLLLLLLFTFLRVGEARVPGPHLADTHLDEDLLWLISANSTGIAHKSSMILQPGVTWLIQESHLTVRGLDHFRKELKATTRTLASNSRIHSLAGHPVEPRRPGTLVGKHAGVLTFGPNPMRELPTLISHEMYETSRVQAVSHLLRHQSVHGLNAYGWTPGYTHLCPQAWTNLLLQDACAGLLSQVKGPRFLAGDLNHDLGDLPALTSLLEAGWLELQTLLQHRRGHSVQPTCKGATQRDFLFLSPELQPLVEDGLLIPDLFPDHTALAIGLRPRHQAVQAWPRPLPLPWDTAHMPASPVPWHPCHTTEEATNQYHAFWRDLEAAQPHPPLRTKGRAAALHPKWITPGPAVPRTSVQVALPCLQQGRMLDALYLQLRRLDSLTRQRAKPSQGIAWLERLDQQWRAIRMAKGFRTSFPSWLAPRVGAIEAHISTWQAPPPLEALKLLQQACRALYTQLTAALVAERQRAKRMLHARMQTFVDREIQKPQSQPIHILGSTHPSGHSMRP